MAAAKKEALTVEVVDVEVVRPLRLEYLRPDQTPDAVEFKTDDHETAQHFAVRADDGSVIGVGSLCFGDRVAGQPPFRKPGMRVRGLAVSEAWRGKGVGSALVEHMFQIGRDAGIVEAWGNVPSRNLPYLEKCGFKAVSSEFEVQGVGLHTMVVRELKPTPGA